jgi:hypothetical protein
LILRKLGAYPRQNSLALALRELGRVERTLFTLEWLQNPELRRRVQVGLNKGEAKNALARAVFFNRLGELRDLTPLSSTAHSGDLVLPFSSFFLEFFSSKLNHRLVACCHQAGILLLQLPADASRDFGVESGRFHTEGDQTFTVLERWAFLTASDAL